MNGSHISASSNVTEVKLLNPGICHFHVLVTPFAVTGCRDKFLVSANHSQQGIVTFCPIFKAS